MHPGTGYTGKLAGGEDRRLIYEGDGDLPLQEAVRKYFLLNSEGPAVHRVAVFDSSGAIKYVISQMDIMQFVYAREKDASWMDMSVKELGPLTSSSALTCTVAAVNNEPR
jgi:hypothetical protein